MTPATYRKASEGDIEAQRGLVNGLMALGVYGSPTVLIQAEAFARLAAARGEPDDAFQLIRVLALRVDDEIAAGRVPTARALMAEGIALLSRLADEGDEQAAEQLNEAVAIAGPDVCADADRLRRQWEGLPSAEKTIGEILAAALMARAEQGDGA